MPSLVKESRDLACCLEEIEKLELLTPTLHLVRRSYGKVGEEMIFSSLRDFHKKLEQLHENEEMLLEWKTSRVTVQVRLDQQGRVIFADPGILAAPRAFVMVAKYPTNGKIIALIRGKLYVEFTGTPIDLPVQIEAELRGLQVRR